jgi:RNA polymerase sigma-70 factor (ECF subfamily)
MVNRLRSSPQNHPGLVPQPANQSASDADLVAMARYDRQGFALIYARYLDPVHRYCYRRLGSREAAEDATSLIFAKAWQALPRLQLKQASFRSWLFTIAHNVVVDAYRVPVREHPLEWADDLLDGNPSPEDLAVAADERDSVLTLLAQLPETQRQVVELRLAGLTGSEIAQTLGLSPGNVGVIQHRAIARLRAWLTISREPAEGIHAQQ